MIRSGPLPRVAVSGTAIATLALLLLPAIDALAKGLTDEMPAVEISFGRFFFHFLFLTAVSRLTGWRWSLQWRRPILLLPGLMMALATLSIFAAFRYLPLAEALAIFFVEPLILTLLAAVLLHERIGWRTLTACITGFAGTLLVVRPNFLEFGWPALFPFVTAISFAFYMILNRRLVAGYTPIEVQIHTGATASVVLAIALIATALFGGTTPAPVIPDAGQWLRLAGIGAIGTLGHFMISVALQRSSASVIAPLQYLEIVSATFLGLVFFGEFPDAIAWLGIAIIVASGLFVHARNIVRTRRA